MTNVRDYAGGYDVVLREQFCDGEKRLVVVATNQGGYDDTEVDLLDLIVWVKQNRPDLLEVE